MIAPMDFERHVEFDGCFNFRDLGGYATVDGHWVRPRLLYRADGPHALTDGDVATLRDLGLATVLDLRTGPEVEDRGRYATHLPGVAEHHLPLTDVLPDPDELPSWIDPLVVAGQYRSMLENGSDAIARALEILSSASEYPALLHCSAGKDRTGILSAVLLGLLGVPDDTIVADYALSARGMHRLVEHYKSSYPDAAEQLSRLAPAMVAADPRTMSAFVAFVRDEYGSFEGYSEFIGAGSAPAALRAVLLS
jgi:protein-tyrosine phosphatase